MSDLDTSYQNPDPERYHYRNGEKFVEIERIRSIPEAIRAQKGQEKDDGWKFHLSVDPKDVSKAWTIVSDAVAEHGISDAKFAKPAEAQRMHDANYPQAGKQITLYCVGDGDKPWPHILRNIEIALRQANIQPSVPAYGDRAVPGSWYIGYRNDKASENLQLERDPKWIDSKRPYQVTAQEIREDLILARGVVAPDMAHNPSGWADNMKDVNFTNDLEVTSAGVPRRGFHRGMDVVRAGVQRAAAPPIVPQQKQVTPALSPEDKALDTLKNGKWDISIHKGITRLSVDADMPEKDMEALMVTMKERGLASRRIDYTAEGKPFIYVTGNDVGKLIDYQNGKADLPRVKPEAKAPAGMKL